MFRDLKRLLARGALVLAALLLLLSALTLPRLGSWLVSEDPLQKADALIVLGGTMYVLYELTVLFIKRTGR